VLVLCAAAIPQGQPDAGFDPAIFKAPPARYRGHAMWNFNLTTINEKDVVSGIQDMAKLNYGVSSLKPADGRSRARAWPSSATNTFASITSPSKRPSGKAWRWCSTTITPFPPAPWAAKCSRSIRAHNLNMAEKDVTRPADAQLAIPKSIYIGAVLMNHDTFELVDVSNRKQQDHVSCRAPKGNWRPMVFYLAEGQTRVVDYLDEKAMTAFISFTYDQYAKNFGNEFGKLITQTFYDEPLHAPRRPDVDTGIQRRF
jgi:hypothetical protein